MSITDQVLDVRTEIPKRRHEMIFEAFTALAPGEAYELVNDHDPKPLRYQFEAEHTGEFTWEYLEQGPEVWRVRIGRAANPEADRAVGFRSDWRDAVGQAGDAPAVTVLHESAELKTVLVALSSGQELPAHPGPAACFHILDGNGTITVDDQDFSVSSGATVVAPTGTQRAASTISAMVFLGNLGDPGAEADMH